MDTLKINGDFLVCKNEGGFDGWTWNQQEGCKMSRQVLDDNSIAILVKYVGGSNKYSVLDLTNTDSARKDLADKIKQKGSGVFRLSCLFLAADEKSVGKKIMIKSHYAYKNKQGNVVNKSYVSPKPISLADNWVKNELVFAIALDAFANEELEYVAIEFLTPGNLDVNVLIKDISFELLSLCDATNFKPAREIIPHKKTLIGAIRWDIWDKTRTASQINDVIAKDEKENAQNGSRRISITSPEMIMRTLSYYPQRAPYFVNFEGKQNNGDVSLSMQSCYEKTGLCYDYEDVMDDLKIKQHPYNHGVSWEEEAKMAMDAGIDYFAYLYVCLKGERERRVTEPAFAHTATNGMLEDGRQMKMVAIVHMNEALVDIDKLESDEEKLEAIIYPRRMMYKAMAQSCYLNAQTPNGEIPILHFYWNLTKGMQDPDELERYKKEARFYSRYLNRKNPEKYRVIDDIYCVAHHIYREVGAIADAYLYNYLGFDAISKYAVPPIVTPAQRANAIKEVEAGKFDKEKEYKDIKLEGGIEWQRLNRIDQCYNTKPSVWKDAFGENYDDYIDRIDRQHADYINAYDAVRYIPTVSLGYNVLPRVKTKVSWCGDYNCTYTQTGTPEQLAKQLSHGLSFTGKYAKEYKNSTNTILVYAWNEFDEGGYLCPTVLTDETGQILKNPDGTNKKNDSILVECAKAIKAFREKEAKEMLK